MAMGFRGFADFRDFEFAVKGGVAALRLAILARGMRFLGD
jgi:hypothetical protein